MPNNFDERFEQLRKNTGAEVPEANTNSGLNFVVATELVDLPSRGLFYPEGHPLHKQESVEIKQMTAKEEDILTNRTYIKKGVVIDRLISSLLINKSINVSSLLVGDKNAIMVAARISAYGPEYNVSLVCDQCGNKSQQSINLTEVEERSVESISAAIDNNPALVHERLQNGNIVVKTPKTGWFVECRMLNGDDERSLLQYAERKKQAGSSEELALSEQLAMIISSINTISDQNTLVQAIQNMPAYDAKHLRDVYAKLVPSVIIRKVYECPSCFSGQNVEVPFTQEFFWPK